MVSFPTEFDGRRKDDIVINIKTEIYKIALLINM